MYKRYYDGYPTESYNYDQGETIIPDSTYDVNSKHESEIEEHKKITDNLPIKTETNENPAVQTETSSIMKKGLFSSLKTDDIILIALLIILAAEQSDDIIMPLIIGYLLLCDFLPI